MEQEKTDAVDEKASQAIKAGVASLDQDAAEFYYACSQHPGGLCESGFASFAEARTASDNHKAATGHTDCYPSSGPCPF